MASNPSQYKHMETAIFGGGCFWCTEAIFRRLKGILSVTSGYAGGIMENPTYDDLHYKNTGHAECIKIVFDPTIISYQKLLDVFWHTHDPTQRNRQNYDVGTEYRSIIFYMNNTQKELAEKSKHDLEQSKAYKSPIVTEIVPYTNFFKAEEIHQNFYEKNSYSPYCSIVIDPKLTKLLKNYGSDVKDEYKNR